MKLDLRHAFETTTTSALRVFLSTSSEGPLIRTPDLKLINIQYPGDLCFIAQTSQSVSLTHLIQTVFLAQLHTLFPAVVTFEEIGNDSSELY